MNGIKLAKYAAVIAATALCVGTTQVNAMTVTWLFNDTNELTLADHTTGVPVGALAEIGYFPGLVGNDAGIAALATPAAIQAAFTAFGTAHIGDLTSGSVGSFGATTIKPGAGLFDAQAYAIVFNTATSAGATQWGVFKGAWTFPHTDTGADPFMDSDSVSPAGVLIGSYGVLTFNSPWQETFVNSLALVPEPSTYALVAMGLLSMWGFRRRRS
jgi:hypothetical protein